MVMVAMRILLLVLLFVVGQFFAGCAEIAAKEKAKEIVAERVKEKVREIAIDILLEDNGA